MTNEQKLKLKEAIYALANAKSLLAEVANETFDVSLMTATNKLDEVMDNDLSDFYKEL